MIRSRHRPLIRLAAARYQLDPYILEAQCWAESSDNPWAFRYEQPFYSRYLAGKPAWDHYGPLGACSFGLLQILFATAVEDGFGGRPEDLFLPATNLDAGAHHFRLLLDQVEGDPAAALAAFNGGLQGNYRQPYRNAGYVGRVLLLRDRLAPDDPPADA